MEKKRTALDILFQEIKESKAVMPNALFGYFEIVYNKAKEIEKEQIKKAYQGNWSEILSDESEEYYNETYGKE
jgi:hypothetical protein